MRVIQWGTGTVGKHAIRAFNQHPDLELVGVRVYNEEKNGVDAGELAGIAAIGVTATTDVEAILALDADCVLHASSGTADPATTFDDVCRLLESRKNVVSTAMPGLIYPKAMGDEAVERLEAACRTGGVSIHGTGIEPGWASEVLPLTMSAVFRSIRSILVQELLDYSSYGVPAIIMDVMGFGQPPDAPTPMSDPERVGGGFRGTLMLLADGLGATIDRWEYERQVALAAEPFDVAAGRIEAGTVAAQRFSATAVIKGGRTLKVEHITRLGVDQAPEWPTGRGWRVEVEGEPSMALETQIGVHGEDENDQACIATAMHGVNAIVPVCAAATGIRTFLDLPLLTARGALGAQP
jgi:2,4-diaminopentanoate dehydrogenase